MAGEVRGFTIRAPAPGRLTPAPSRGRGSRVGRPVPFSSQAIARARGCLGGGAAYERRLQRHKPVAAAGRPGRPGAVRRQAGAVPPPAAAHRRLAARPPAARPHRPFGRDPGDVPGGFDPAGGVPAEADDAVLPVAALPGRPEAGDAAPPSPGQADAGRRPGGLALPGPAARDHLGRPGRPTPGARGPAERGGHPRRAEDPPPGGAQQHGPARPRNPGPAPLRATEPGGDGPGAGAHGVGGVPAPPARPEAAQGGPEQSTGRPGRAVAMNEPHSELDVVGRVAEGFLARYRRGERPSLTEYTARYPELAEQIRDLFPALVVMEELGSVEGPRAGAPARALPGPGQVPEQLGDYRIVREVGRGGMGVVYEAVQESLGRHVALKVLAFHGLLPPTHLERFRREAKAAARLHHTNIVPVHGVGEHEGVHYYAMQFIQGQGLDKVLADVRRLRRQQPGETAAEFRPSEGSVAQSLVTGQFAPPPGAGPDEPNERPGPSSATTGLSAAGPEAEYYRGVARLGVQVAEALAYAHRQGILHRDIKPSNLLLDLQGTVWITDFGLAKA